MKTTTDPDISAREALRLLGLSSDNWVPDRPDVDCDVIDHADRLRESVRAWVDNR